MELAVNVFRLVVLSVRLSIFRLVVVSVVGLVVIILLLLMSYLLQRIRGQHHTAWDISRLGNQDHRRCCSSWDG